MMKHIFLLSLISIALFGCKTYSEDDKQDFDQKIENYLKHSDVKYKKSESGLYYCIEEVGSGPFIKLTDEVSFTYQGKLLNGDFFDRRYTNKPITFRVSELITGWKEAMMYLKKGGKVKLIVPPQLGYGDYELDDIPKNSVLVFNMEVKEVN